MGQLSTIEWTDHTFNPWWGCTKVSPGCAHCYAETWSARYGHKIWGPRASRRIFGEQHWNEPLKWNRKATLRGRRERVFCASMADVFEDNLSIDLERVKLWALIEETPMLDWLLLTKRPENMVRFAPWREIWPPNVWAMTSVENQEQAEKRIPFLTQVPAVVRGLSVEPLIGAVDLAPWLDSIHWVIVGGESGRESRPMNPAWVSDVRDQCATADVPFFFKQWGEWAPSLPDAESYRVMDETIWQDHMQRLGKKTAGRLLDGRTWDDLPRVDMIEQEFHMSYASLPLPVLSKR